MKARFFSVSCLLFLLVVLAGCGGTSSHTRMNTGGSPLPSGTRGTTTGSTMMTTVQVTETEFQIDASVTGFTPGTAFHFVVTNKGKTAHEFMIMPKSEGAMHGMSMGEIDRMALARIATIAPGETKAVNYTF